MSSFARKTKMKCFSCCMSDETLTKWSLQKSIKEHHDTKVLASYANISFDPDDDRKRLIGKETTKGCKGNATAKVFKYDELCNATNNFNPRNQIGEGGFGRVYRGLIENPNRVVAVKQLDRHGYQGNKEFLVEVLMLVLLKHPNLVELVGYCIDGDQRVLVYEYMTNGSLEDHLLGRRAVDNSKPPDERNLVTWAKPLMDHRRKFVLLADPLLDGECPVKGLHQALTVAAMCLQEEPSLRPLMSYVVAALEGLITSDEPEEGKHMGNEHHTSSNGGRLSI
ncbi:hypothetical protein GQ457_02G037330 [Hibiscus cannabinus]